MLPQVKENACNFGYTKLFGDKIIIGGMAGDQQAAAIGQACFSAGQSKEHLWHWMFFTNEYWR